MYCHHTPCPYRAAILPAFLLFDVFLTWMVVVSSVEVACVLVSAVSSSTNDLPLPCALQRRSHKGPATITRMSTKGAYPVGLHAATLPTRYRMCYLMMLQLLTTSSC
jgi:hypothetical protein